MSKRRLWTLFSAGLIGLVAAVGLVRMLVFPAKPPGPLVKLIGTYDTPGEAYGVALAGSFAYVADGDEGLRILDVSDPTSPTLVGDLGAFGDAMDVVVSNLVAYVTTDSWRMQTMDVSNPAEPEPLGGYPATPRKYNWLHLVAVRGSLAYFMDFTQMGIMDVRNPSAPVLVGSYRLPGHCRDLAIEGSVACMIMDRDKRGHLILVDVSNPSAPRDLGDVIFPADPPYESAVRSLFVSGEMAYVEGSVFEPEGDEDCIIGDEPNWDYLHIVDISDPRNPSIRRSIPNGSGFAAVSGSVAFALITKWIDADRYQELHIVNLSDPMSPDPLETILLPGEAMAVSVSGTTVYVSCGTAWLRILDVSDLLEWAGLEAAPQPL